MTPRGRKYSASSSERRRWQAEETIAAEAALEVAKAGLKAAEADAASQVARAEAERAVVEKRTTAGAEVLRQEVAVYRDEADYVRARLYAKIAPNLVEVLTADRPGEPFGLPFRAADDGAKKPAAPPAKGAAKVQ